MTPLMNTKITTRILGGFDDVTFNETHWSALLASGKTNKVNLTWRWQRCWWNSFGRGKLLLILAEADGIPIALAPLFADNNMVYNIFPEDALDFIGDISNPLVLDAILQTARDTVDGFQGFRFYFIPDDSDTGHLLMSAALRLDLDGYEEGFLPSPYIDIKADPDEAVNMTRKKSLRRHENYFLREGTLEIFHYHEGKDISLHLDEFFDQHIKRRAVTSFPSIFLKEEQKNYYRILTDEISSSGWLSFTRINWNSRAIAFHYGLLYNGRYLFGIPTFEIALADHSPGEVLLRQLLLAAIEEGASSFDFGIGDEAYKYRFANRVTKLYNWGLYPQQK